MEHKLGRYTWPVCPYSPWVPNSGTLCNDSCAADVTVADSQALNGLSLTFAVLYFPRLFNHSCAANVAATEVRQRYGWPRIVMFALRDIAAGEPLTLDYTPEGIKNRELPGLTPCLCGAVSCRGLTL